MLKFLPSQSKSPRTTLLPRLLGLGVLALLVNCGGATKPASGDKAMEGYKPLDELYIVDCSLPSEIRKLGTGSFLAPRKAIKTTAVDCNIRGGEFEEYSRADYRSALRAWLPQAQAGDKEAQNYVGEIFEKGLGQTPDYVSAASWYKKSAEQGYTRAQINLGYMYEKGMGVPKDMTVALNFYRKASGLENDQLVLNSDMQKELAQTREKLNKDLASAQIQSDLMKKQLAGMQAQLEKSKVAANKPAAGAAPTAGNAELEAITKLYEKAEADKKALLNELQSTEVAYRTFSKQEILKPTQLNPLSTRTFKNINFGHYYALIIGNQDYQYLDKLRSPISDAKKLKQILELKYGFSTLLIENGTEKQILNTINDFYAKIGENDNLLIYYAGHGQISTGETSKKERGYWLPVDAQANVLTNWINNSVISDHLDRIKARSVLVIADSCYAGVLGSEKSPLLFGVSGGTLTEASIKASMGRRARVVISSGGLSPVMDGTGSNNSVFASALLESLEQNKEPMRDSALFSLLAVNVSKRTANAVKVEVPEMKPVREAGHAGGTFYFVPTI